MTIAQFMASVTPIVPKDPSVRRNLFLLHLNDNELNFFVRNIVDDEVVLAEMKRELEIRKNELVQETVRTVKG